MRIKIRARVGARVRVRVRVFLFDVTRKAEVQIVQCWNLKQ